MFSLKRKINWEQSIYIQKLIRYFVATSWNNFNFKEYSIHRHICTGDVHPSFYSFLTMKLGSRSNSNLDKSVEESKVVPCTLGPALLELLKLSHFHVSFYPFECSSVKLLFLLFHFELHGACDIELGTFNVQSWCRTQIKYFSLTTIVVLNFHYL